MVDYTSQFKNAIMHWDLPKSTENNGVYLHEIERYERIIKNKLVALDKITAIYITETATRYRV